MVRPILTDPHGPRDRRCCRHAPPVTLLMAGHDSRADRLSSGLGRSREPRVDLSRFDALTFDCYGTLIDWERGLLAALRPILRRHGIACDDEWLLGRYAAAE